MIAINPNTIPTNKINALKGPTDEDFQRIADDANAMLHRTQGGKLNSSSINMNETMRKEPITTEGASKVFIRTLNQLAPLGWKDDNQTKVFWELVRNNFASLKNLVEYKNHLSPALDEYHAVNAIKDSIIDKSLIQEMEAFEQALKENQIKVDEDQFRLLKLVAEEPFTVAMRELGEDERKQKKQIQLADPEQVNNSGPVKPWHLALLVYFGVSFVQIFRKGFVKGVTDPMSLFFGAVTIFEAKFKKQYRKIRDFILSPIKKLFGKQTIEEQNTLAVRDTNATKSIELEKELPNGYKVLSIRDYNPETKDLIKQATEIEIAEYLKDKIGDQETLNQLIQRTANLLSKKSQVTPMIITLSPQGNVAGFMSPAARLDMFMDNDRSGYPQGLVKALKQKVLNPGSEYYKANQPHPNQNNTWEIAGIVIDSEHRGKGLATELYDVREKYFKSQGAQYIAYNHNLSNRASQKLADKKGYDHNSSDWYFDHSDEGKSVLRMKKLS